MVLQFSATGVAFIGDCCCVIYAGKSRADVLRTGGGFLKDAMSTAWNNKDSCSLPPGARSGSCAEFCVCMSQDRRAKYELGSCVLTYFIHLMPLGWACTVYHAGIP